MSPEAHIFTANLEKFTTQSLQWCAAEAEKATGRILQSIDMILEDAQRVSHISSESLEAIRDLQGQFGVNPFHTGQTEDSRSIASIIKDLKGLADEHEGIKDIVGPIVVALQFQDRLRQNFENLAKMISCWLEYREKVTRIGNFDAETKSSFVSELYAATTMEDERNEIHRVFPDEPQPEAIEEDALFF